VPFLGLDSDSFESCICMVSPCMMGGNVLQYVKSKKPNVDIIGLVGIFLCCPIQGQSTLISYWKSSGVFAICIMKASCMGICER
jgi:hypothetical protein